MSGGRSMYEVQSHPALGAETSSETRAALAVSKIGTAAYPLVGTLAYPAGNQGSHNGHAMSMDLPTCTFFLRTGTCAYGDRCKFLHPHDRPPPVLNVRGYPVRSDEFDCPHYLKKGWCAFNLTCKFNHPELAPPVLPSSSYGIAASQQQYVNVPAAAASGFVPGGAMYSLEPSAMPVMYYVPSPIGPASMGANGFPGGAMSLQAAYPASAAGLVAAVGPALYRHVPQQQQQLYRQQQQQMYRQPSCPTPALVPQQQQLYRQQQQVYSTQPDAEQIANTMHRLRLGRGDGSISTTSRA